MKKSLFLLSLLILAGVQTLLAQQQVVTGKVVGEDQLGIPGVNVLIHGTTNGTITDLDGNYTISVPELNVTLIYSFIGYKNQEVAVQGREVINITMVSEAIGLEEVVAVGYGTQIKSKITSAVSTVNTEVLDNRPVSSISEALAGAAPGLQVNLSSGAPGSTPSINIRGLSTIGHSSGVLVLIDGMEGSMADVDPAMVKNISVLKDAAAAAIYGARAANGVVLITTKEGKNSQKTNVNYMFDYGIQSPTTLPELVNSVEYMEMKNRALGYEGKLPEFSTDMIELARNGELSETYWPDALYDESAVRMNHSLNISGGSKKSTFFLGLGALDQQGIVKGNDDYKRYNLRVKLETDVNKWLSVGTNTSWSNRVKDNVPIDTGRSFRAAPFFPSTLEDGTYVVGLGGDSSNPVMKSESGSYNLEESDVIESQLFAKLKLVKGLSFEQKVIFKRSHINKEVWRDAVNYVTMNVDDSGYTDIVHVQPQSVDRSLSYQSEKSLRTTTQSFLRYNWENEDHFFKGLLGFQSEENKYDSFRAGTYDFLNGSLQDLDLGAAADPEIGGGTGSTSSSSEWAIASLLGRLNYDYKRKYMVEFSFRYDGTSRFAEGNKWGFFPSVSLGWNMKNENFMKETYFLDMLKLRGSWGQLGDAFKVKNYSTYQIVNQNSGYVWPEGTRPGLVTGAAANGNITWETATVMNMGVDASLWKGRLGIQTEYYINKRSDILGYPDVAWEFGLGAPAQNVRDVKSWGWELSISHKNKLGKLGYEVLLNISDQNNEVTDLGSTTPDIGNKFIDVGYAINSLYGYRSDGLITSQEDLDDYLSQVSLDGPYSPYVGSIKLKDISGPDGTPDGIIDAQYDREVFHDDIKHFMVGGRIALSYEGFTLSAIIDGVLDRDVYFSGNQNRMAFSGGTGTPFTYQRDAFDPTTPDANAIMPIMTSELVNYDYSDYWLRKASYVRMKNISLNYTFNKSLMSRIGFLHGASIFTSVENPFIIWTNYFAHDYGWDPQLSPSSVNYPLARTISFGCNLKF
ncbi:MAG: TonB-dependent receptor [Carboxylicivirga sp.]|jgi:TonB-linked SusC/RagA family outer membrane protein|nr:TonB-dependent receptor [Carboxylicivirga sp.]